MRFFIVLMCILSTHTVQAIFDDCQCPVVTCEPCQVQIVLGREAKSCGVGRTIQCEKSVCENVDNYFQCVAGEPAVFVPAKNQTSHITEPQYSNIERVSPNKKNEINFDKINATQDWEDESAPMQAASALASQSYIFAPRTEESTHNSLDLDHLRSIASVPVASGELKVLHLAGKMVSSQKQRVSKNQVLKWGQFISAEQDSGMTVEWADGTHKGVFDLKLKKKTQLHFQKEDGFVVLTLMQGRLEFVSQKMQVVRPLLFDLGEWRFGKREGVVVWQRNEKSQVVTNAKESLWLRKNDLMARATEITPGNTFDIDPQGFITHFKFDQPSEMTPSVERYQLSVPVKSLSRRGLASQANSVGCQSPAAEYEQCAWKCFGTKNSKTCDTSQKQTRCVRFTCDASGEWKLPTFSAGSLCDATETRVGYCQ